MNTLRVLHVITGLGTGGAETSLLRLITHTAPLGIAHTVASLLPDGPLAAPMRDAGAHVHSMEMSRGVADPRVLRRLAQLVRQTRADVVHGWMYHANLAASAAAWMAHRPVIWGIRHALDAYAQEPSRLRAVIRAGSWVSHHARAVVYNSARSAQQHAALGYAQTRTLVLPNGFDTEALAPDHNAGRAVRESLGLDLATPVVGLIARVDPLKDHDTFLAAAQQLQAMRPSVRFLLVGRDTNDPTGAIARGIRERGLSGLVYTLGERRDIRAVFNSCTVATLTSRSEGFPNAVGEAMACGIPCVVTDVGDAGLLVGDTGRIVPVGDAGAIAQAWCALLDESAEARAARGESARNRIAERFSLGAHAAAYQTLWHNVVTEAGTAHKSPEYQHREAA
jgi:glycosyltransferase involved in cell wall biosynthesis